MNHIMVSEEPLYGKVELNPLNLTHNYKQKILLT
ncbi:unnamed protein product [Paramecium primaurelia]|uniref:Uncharacterized protein n=1 Tax=Paramecium primaurelia TaxID=5886 RepID=A0A8S1N164_PARPR|nr:unnamed protein product [Paramecium primaurelia]